MAASKALMSYLEQYALISLEKQDKLQALIGDALHDLDLEAGIIRFNDIEFPLQVIGTESDNTLTWLWAWADEQTEIPASLMQSAIQLRTWGDVLGIPEFTTPSVDVNIVDGQAIALIAAEVCKSSSYYADHYEGGAAYLLVSDKGIDQHPPFDRQRLLHRMSDLFSQYELNHRNTLLSYLQKKDLFPVSERNMISCELESGERLNAEFDDAGQLLMVNGAVFEI
jgi:hypothetical protein